MNETLYRWTFNFHKVVRQQNLGAVEDFILPYSAVYLRNQKWKNYWNRSTFAEVIVIIKVARFYGPQCIYCKDCWANRARILHIDFRIRICSFPSRAGSPRCRLYVAGTPGITHTRILIIILYNALHTWQAIVIIIWYAQDGKKTRCKQC